MDPPARVSDRWLEKLCSVLEKGGHEGILPAPPPYSSSALRRRGQLSSLQVVSHPSATTLRHPKLVSQCDGTAHST